MEIYIQNTEGMLKKQWRQQEKTIQKIWAKIQTGVWERNKHNWPINIWKDAHSQKSETCK